MQNLNFHSPLVLIAFNRPELLAKQVSIIKKSYNGKIYAIIDGPRNNVPGETEKNGRVREIIEDLKENYLVEENVSSTNLGCYSRIKSGLDWVFKKTEQAIILEDDCHPSPAFFDYATKLLDWYRDDERIYSICGSNFQPSMSTERDPYFLSRYPLIWGWATWARAWENYVSDPDDWVKFQRSKKFGHLFSSFRERMYWRYIFGRTYTGNIGTWDYQWVLTSWINNGLAIHPRVNLITNVGDTPDSTHVNSSPLLHLSCGDLCVGKAALKDPVLNIRYDNWIEDNVFSKSLSVRIKWILSKLIPANLSGYVKT